jgi:alpha-glucosidase
MVLSVISLLAWPLFFTRRPASDAPTVHGDSPVTAVQTVTDGVRVRLAENVLQVTAVSARAFRVALYPADQPLPEEWGTFRSAYRPFGRAKTRQTPTAVAVQTVAGVVHILRRSGSVLLTDPMGRPLYGPVQWRRTRNGWEAASEAPAGERIYGFGNASRHEPESLIKTTGTIQVKNGVSQAPFLWSTAGYGVLLHCEKPLASWRRDQRRHTWLVEEPAVDMYLLMGETPAEILQAYIELTGRPLVPPRWTFGYLQSRWGYKDARDVRDKWRLFREKKILVEAFIYDYDWFINDWHWNPKVFPSPRKDLAAARRRGIRTVLIRKPRVHGEHHAFAEQRVWIGARRRSWGDDLNFALPEVRRWWWSQHVPLVQDGIAGWWNDEAEQYYPEFFYMTLAQFEGLADTKPGYRNWSLNRAFTPGIQRLGAAVWTGDVLSDWKALRKTNQTLLNHSLTGMYYSCSDIGGFEGTPSAELFIRWMQAAAFHPVMRAHGGQNSNRWPWGYGAEAEAAIRKAIEVRYTFLPYWYSLAHDAYRTGKPLMRPVFWEFPCDRALANMDDAWLVGPSLYVAPQLSPGGRRSVYLPAGAWYSWPAGKTHRGPVVLPVRSSLSDIPLYVRPGSILPMAAVPRHSDLIPRAPLRIEVFGGANGEFTLCEDDGISYGYQSGQVARTPIHWNNQQRQLTINAVQGAYPGQPTVRSFHIRIRGTAAPRSVHMNRRWLPRSRWSYDAKAQTVDIETQPQSVRRAATVNLVL